MPYHQGHSTRIGQVSPQRFGDVGLEQGEVSGAGDALDLVRTAAASWLENKRGKGRP